MIVLEGFAILLASHFIGGYFLSACLGSAFPHFPNHTIALLASFGICLPLTILYMALRTKHFPKFSINIKTFLFVLVSPVMIWLLLFVKMITFGKGDSQGILEIIKGPIPYSYINLFIFLLWGPFAEEILNRGYFYEILKWSWSKSVALIISTILFTIPHYSFSSEFTFSFFIIPIYSVIFTVMYMYGGIIAASASHIFLNLFLFAMPGSCFCDI